MKKLKKLVMVSLFSFVLFISILVLLQKSALATDCPLTYNACQEYETRKCWTTIGTPDEGCCIQIHNQSCDDIYPACHNTCW